MYLFISLTLGFSQVLTLTGWPAVSTAFQQTAESPVKHFYED
jgi:hypothetical protein